MVMWKPRLSGSQRIGLGGAMLLALGAAGGAAAVSHTRPSVEMAPTIATPVARLSTTSGVVTVRGRIAAVYGDRFLVQDQSGRALVDAGRGGASALRTGSPILVQGRYDDGQLRARYLVDGTGTIEEVGPRHPRPDRDGPRPGRRDGPPPPGGPDAPPRGGPDAPPPPGAGPAAGGQPSPR